MDITLTKAQSAQFQAYLAANPGLQQTLNINTVDEGVTLSGVEVSRFQQVLNAAWKLDSPLPPPASSGNRTDASLLDNKLGNVQRSAQTDMLAIMTLVHEMAQQQRKVGHTAREASYEQRWSAMDVAVDKMKSAAALRFAAAMTQGVFQLGMGVVGVRAGAKGFQQAKQANAFKQQANKLQEGLDSPAVTAKPVSQQGLKKLADDIDVKSQPAASKTTTQNDINKPANDINVKSQPAASKTTTQNDIKKAANDIDVNPQPAASKTTTRNDIKKLNDDAEFLSTQSQATVQMGQAVGNASQGVGAMLGGAVNYSADTQQVEQKQAEIQGDKAQSLVEKEGEFMHRMMEIISDIRQKMQAIEESNNATAKKIWA